jgi:hypothetical protein
MTCTLPIYHPAIRLKRLTKAELEDMVVKPKGNWGRKPSSISSGTSDVFAIAMHDSPTDGSTSARWIHLLIVEGLPMFEN